MKSKISSQVSDLIWVLDHILVTGFNLRRA